MKFIIAAIGMLIPVMSTLVGRVLLALGIGYVTYKGMDVTASFLLNQIKDGLSQMPTEVIQFLAFCWIDKAIGMIFSAWMASIALKGLASGMTKLKIK